MAIVILGATGGTGRHLVRQALDRGLDVRAASRRPAPDMVRADVHDPASIAALIGPDDVVVSALGVSARAEAGTLTAGARAVLAARPRHIIWLGAMGVGRSAPKISAFTRRLLRTAFGPEQPDKEAADTAILDAGGTVVHSGMLGDGPDNPEITLARLADLPHRFWPMGAPRATVARLMLDEVASPRAGLLGITRRTR
ncbi:NAD(P)-dependent oxidoreductase [Actinoplanes sp. NPDC049265]|uniref:NAD(P)-dependent oxidoreductase n=1 Tax=Actinoplanes sp. NPDC049265 TaxID=3363902 RepID=UPI00371B9CA7